MIKTRFWNDHRRNPDRSALIQAGYDYCGVEYGTECWGSTVIASGTEETSLGSCGKACKGDTTQYCGGSGAISIYKATSDKGMLKTNPGPAGSSFVGCYNEGSGSRALTGATYANSNMTVSSCVSYCKSKELLYAGLEYSREWCALPLSCFKAFFCVKLIEVS